MKIPCAHEAHADGCHHCRLAATVEGYARLWDRPWPPGFEVAPSPPPPPVPEPPRPVPTAEWPRYARWVARSKRPGERGVGDTVARKLGPAGEKFKAWFKRITGFDCGCADRQAWLNNHYPYA